ncbi:MAG TPA: hypothetical protein DCM05_00695, partial [Elusimicrobia bacterium]|nr:hypothetical protein [Elusimicrobiota bacterium]
MKKLAERFLYNPKFFLCTVSGVGLVVVGLWGLRLSMRPADSGQREAAASAGASLSHTSPPLAAPKAGVSQARSASAPAEGARFGAVASEGMSFGSGSSDGLADSMPKSLATTGREDPKPGDKKPAKALETQPVKLASSKPTAAAAEESREAVADEAAEEVQQKEPRKLQSLDKLNQTDYAPGASAGGGTAAAAPAPAPKAAALKPAAEKPRLQPLSTASGPTSVTPSKGFFRSNSSSGGRTLRTGGPGGFRMPGENSGAAQAALPSGETGGAAFAMAPRAAIPPTTAGAAIAQAAGGGDRGAAVGAGGGAAGAGGAGGGGGVTQGGGHEGQAETRAAAKKADIAKQAKKHLEAANKFKSGVMLSLARIEWGQASLPALKQKAAAAQARMESLDAAVQASILKFSGYPSVVSALTDTHYLIAGRAGREDGNFIGRLKASQSNVDVGLRDVALLPDNCGYQISVPKPRTLDPRYPRASAGDLSQMGFSLSTPKTQHKGDCYWMRSAECEPRTYGTEYVHDSSLQAHQKLGYAVDQTITVRADALQAADIVPNELTALETSLRNHMRPDLLGEMRAIGQRIRTDLQAAAALLPDPQTVSPAVNMSAAAQSAEASRKEIQALLD